MKVPFFKFPSTPHLAKLAGVEFREDKVLSVAEREQFLKCEIVVEEKLDGANLGVSFNAEGELCLQNRGEYLIPPYIGQWEKIGIWLSPRVNRLFDVLSDKFILFGEWCYIKHSVAYEKLPDWFLGFDVYDRIEGRFFSSQRRNFLFKEVGVISVPQIAHGKFSLQELIKMMSTSQYGSQPAEGLYLRYEDKDWLRARTKLVRPHFVQSIGRHWSSAELQKNAVQYM